MSPSNISIVGNTLACKIPQMPPSEYILSISLEGRRRSIHDDYMTVLNPGVIILVCETGTCLHEQVRG